MLELLHHGLWRCLGRARRCSAAQMARGRPKTTRNTCNAARLVAGEHQDETQASAPRCVRRIPSAEAAANDVSAGRDRNGRDRDATADSERAPSTQLTGHVALDVVARLHEDLQARRFKPFRAPRLTAENRLARLSFCRDVLQRGPDARGVLRREVLPV